MRRLNRSLGDGERRMVSERIFGEVERLPAFGEARTVALFCALPDEPDTAGALARWRAVKRVVVPCVEGDAMRFFDYDPGTMRRGAFGIEEPDEGARLSPPGEIDLIVVPGTAFTGEGARLGRGRGYYDRYMAQPSFRAFRVGVCYAHQIVDTLPVEPHDAAMDVVIAG